MIVKLFTEEINFMSHHYSHNCYNIIILMHAGTGGLVYYVCGVG